ncbi:MAG: flagellar protein FlaG [Ghiorsea sp.]|nr:flagellar protein FlaG [Ghiorsea sp.]
METIQSISSVSAVTVTIPRSSAPSVQVFQPKVAPQAAVIQPAQTQAVTTQLVQNKPESMVSEQELKQVIQQVSQSFAGSNEAVSFTYEEKLGQLFVQITDSTSGKVIREVPSKEFIQHQVAMKELIGLLLDKQA